VLVDADSGGEEPRTDVGYLVATGCEAVMLRECWLWIGCLTKTKKQLAKCRRPALRMQLLEKTRAGCTDDRRSVAAKCHFSGCRVGDAI